MKNGIIAEKRVSTLDILTAKDMIKNVCNLSDKMLEELNIRWKALLGVGLAVPGIFYKENPCIVNSTNEMYENKPLKDMFENIFGLPTYIENESNLYVIVEIMKV